jgi:hypothetical protein
LTSVPKPRRAAADAARRQPTPRSSVCSTMRARV